MTDQTSTITFDWKPTTGTAHTVKTATVEIDGFTCLVKVHMDYDHDWTDARGKFTDNWEPGVILNPSAFLAGDTRDHTRYKYFLPENGFDFHFKGLLDMGKTNEEAVELANQYVYDSALVAGDPEGQGYAAYGVTCEVFREIRQKDSQGATYIKTVVLGEDGLWGIETGKREYDSAPYIDECANGVLNGALEDAKRTLAHLRAES